MTRPRSMRLLIVGGTAGAVLSTLTQLAPAAASPEPVFPSGPGHTMVIDPRTGELLSVTSAAPLEDAVVKQFDALPGPKTYTLDVSSGGVVAITRT